MSRRLLLARVAMKHEALVARTLTSQSHPWLQRKDGLSSCFPTPLSTVTTTRRQQSGLSSISSYFADVIRTKSLQPPNPILTTTETKKLPQLDQMLPYHLEKAVHEVKQQYMVDLAELEVALTDHKELDILDALGKLETPLIQMSQVGSLFTELASPPDQFTQWRDANYKSKRMIQSLPWRRSKLVYQALINAGEVPKLTLLDFEKQGVQLDDNEEREKMESVYQELLTLKERFQTASSRYTEAPKSARLQMVSDMYNTIGLSQWQAQALGHRNVLDMRETVANSADELLEVHKQVADFLLPHLPPTKLSLDDEAGAFLGSKQEQTDSPSEEQKELWKAKHSAKSLLYLHGVLQGLSDFVEAMFGIKMEISKLEKGWNKNVKVIHLYDLDESKDVDSDHPHLGTVYLDPFQDSYWRSEAATDLVMTRAYRQPGVPVAIVALKTAQTWDDAPTPLRWEDTRDLLFQFGKALQLILEQGQPKSISPPVDVSDFLATFIELWLQNDGFLQRLAQLSQDQFTFQPELIKILREDLKKQKAMEIMNSAFLGALELTMFSSFDPRGEETLAALQGRLAKQYIPHDIPDSSDLSPLLEIFQEDDNGGSPAVAYSGVYSEVLAAMVYEKFQNTDLSDREEAKRLGRSIRSLFLRDTRLEKKDVEELCGKHVTTECLKRVYDF